MMKRKLTGLIQSSGPHIARIQLTLVVALVAVVGTLAVTRIFAASGAISIVPASSSVNLGSTVSVAIRSSTGTDAVNAVQANITYDATKLEYLGVDETGSAFPLVAATNATAGSLSLTRSVGGGAAGVTGDSLITTVRFKALVVGSSQISVADGSVLLRATDNTDILAIRNNATIVTADTAAPTAPVGVTAVTRNLTSISLSWTASTDNVAVTGYRVFRGGTEVGTSTTTTFTDANGLTPGTGYRYTVLAYDAAGNVSAQSVALSVSTLPDTAAPTVPGKPASPTQTMTSVSLTWTASTDNVAVTGYRVYRGGAAIGTSPTPSYTDNGLTVGTGYSYTVAAYDAAGNESAQSAATPVNTLPDSQAPSVPSGIDGFQTGRSVSITWAASTDNVAVTGYIVYRNGVQLGSALVTGTAYTDANVPAGAHTYTVAARDGAGNTSAKSAGLAITVFGTSDITRDGKVDVFDLSTLLSNWGRAGSTPSDITGDGKVDVFDLSTLLSNWTR